MGRLISGCIPSCSPWVQLRWVSSLLHSQRWLKDVSVCELVRQHTSITVSLHWLNVLLMREGECECGDGFGWVGWGGGGLAEWKESCEGQKDRKAKSFESRKLTAKPIPFDSHQWVLMVEGKDREREREREHLCVCGWVHVSVHVWIRLHVGAENKWAQQQYGVSVGYSHLIIRSESALCVKTWLVSRFRYEHNTPTPPWCYLGHGASSLSDFFNWMTKASAHTQSTHPQQLYAENRACLQRLYCLKSSAEFNCKYAPRCRFSLYCSSGPVCWITASISN